ncbi:MAG: phytanoyl-CoA dioxygenase family protein [Candidatus Latescibacteria bacterium]|nr:phytanoyl-CoA dioxygenase family protein [Candidatus Latescibacterota bacterium]
MEAATTESPYRSLTQEQIDTFRSEGYIPIGKLIEDSDLEELRSEYDRTFDEARESTLYRNLSADGGAAQRHDEGAEEEMLQIMQMCERSLAFRRLLYHEPILDIAEDLIGPNIQLFHDQALFKPAHHGGPIHPHQDNAYWRCLPANLVSCWLTLDDVDVDNGAMHLLPGSHLAAMGHERGDVLLDAGTPDPAESRVVPLPAGGALFHHCQTLHFTPPNHTDRQRRAFAIHFMTPGTRSPGGELPIGFSRPLLRGHM